MPVLPLFDPHPANANAAHKMASPGGFESWHFHVNDPVNELQIRAEFHVGFPYHPEYLASYRSYLRSPTTRIPPTPAQYSVLWFSLHHRRRRILDRIDHSSQLVYPGDGGVTVGHHELLFHQSSFDLTLRIKGCDDCHLSFSPVIASPPLEIECLDKVRWIIAAPRCDVSGKITVEGHTLQINGEGFHDHLYGPAPLAGNVSRLLRGHARFPDRTIVFLEMDQSNRKGGHQESYLVEQNATGLSRIDVDPFDPIVANSPESEKSLTLGPPRMLHRTPFSTDLQSTAVSGADQGKASVRVTFPSEALRMGARWRIGSFIRKVDPPR